MGNPSVGAKLDGEHILSTVISNSLIYGLIRRNARDVIEKGIAADAELAAKVAAVHGAWTVIPPTPESQRVERKPTADYLRERGKLRDCLMAKLRWNERDAALMIEYASLDWDASAFPSPFPPRDRWYGYPFEATGATKELENLKLEAANLGVLDAIGEQKATQFFARLAGCFDREAASGYEAIFTAWGGDVRERSIDLQTGAVRPREMSVPKSNDLHSAHDPTVYTRMDYLDPDAELSKEEKASCQMILKNLPVVFTFAPMNLLLYQVKFPARSTRLVTVRYFQYLYTDTRGLGSYQLAYVLHPATLWNEFGPIHLKINVPKDIACRASAPLNKAANVRPNTPAVGMKVPSDTYTAVLTELKDKSGELFVGIDKAAWDAQHGPRKSPKKVASRTTDTSAP